MILNGWREIANHLGRGLRTVQRWESLGLPVRRPNRKDHSAVCAFSEELDTWLRTIPGSGRADDTRASTGKGRRDFPARILLVDDDEALLVTTAAVLAQEGYEVRTARDGFEALAVLRGGVPDVLVSDLKMPNMSGFELLSIVRKRFPAISVIVLSGEFTPITSPIVLADRYVQKGTRSASQLKEMVRELLSASPLRAQPAKSAPAPTWIPRASNGYIIMTCSECLRPFSVLTAEIEIDKVASERCPHCGHDLMYLINSTVEATDAVPPNVLRESNKRVRASKEAMQEAIEAANGSLDE